MKPDHVNAGLMLVGGGGISDDAVDRFIRATDGGDIVFLDAASDPRTKGSTFSRFQSKKDRINTLQEFFVSTAAQAVDPALLAAIGKAEGIFLGGGDQDRYLSIWKGTPLYAAIQARFATGNLVLGGTSAGMAVLGGIVYHNNAAGGVSSRHAMADPYYHLPFQTTAAYDDTALEAGTLLAGNFAAMMSDVLTDTHIDRGEGRLGRDAAFLARMAQDLDILDAKAICASEGGSVFIDTHGIGYVDGSGVYFLHATELPTVCSPGTPLSISNIDETYVSGVGGGMFDVGNWSSNIGDQELSVSSTISVVNGHFFPGDPYSPGSVPKAYL